MPCPFGLDIPELFKTYNLYGLRGKEEAKVAYDKFQVRSDACRSCHKCEKVCPQSIGVSQVMKKIAELLG